MAWSLYRWVWRLESPLHIGIAPAGMLNRTRLYMPARTLWGALTAELARLKNQQFPDYEKVGAELQKKTRLSYFYPAEKVNGRWIAWLPHFKEREGLVWEREDGRIEGDRKFRNRLLITRPGTAIEPESDTAAEGTLREFEMISPYWRADKTSFQALAMVGYIFSQDEGIIQELVQIRLLLIGGDTRYGLGKLRQVIWQKANNFFNNKINLNNDEPVVTAERVLAHTRPSSGLDQFKGAMEYLGGWDIIRGGLKIQGLTWVPGSVLENAKNGHDFVIQEDGLWSKR